MYKVSMEDAKARLPELVRAALRGETVLIAQDDEQAVQLVPVRRAIGRKTGSAKGAVVTGEPFDSPDDDFDDVLQA
jgi:antitoxin (DNA-binding transcriptional repressor) of toxin-antitoxin stability system